MTDQELRMRCIEAAVKSTQGFSSAKEPQNIVEIATKFEQYVVGTSERKPKRSRKPDDIMS